MVANYAAFIYLTCINKHNVLQLSSMFVFIFFNEIGNQQYLKYLFHSCVFLYNFLQTFFQYMYLSSAVFGLKVGSEIHFYLCHYVQTIITIELRHVKTCLLRFCFGPTQLGCTVKDDGYKGLIFRILILVGLYYLSIMRKH